MSTSLRIFAHPRAWLIPVVFVLGLAALLPLIYLSATVDPRGNLHNLPIATVVEAQDTSGSLDGAAVVSDAITEHIGEEFSVTPLDSADLAAAFGDDQIAAAIIIPADFNTSLGSLLDPTSASPSIPTVRIVTNAGDGGLSNGLVSGSLIPLLNGISQTLGEQLLASPAGSMLPPANRLLVSQPIHIETSPFTPLPANSGLGTSAFYYALVLVLVGFVGASVVNPLLDSVLGFGPSEVGPIVQRRNYQHVSRLTTLAAKFAVLIAIAPFAAVIVQLVATLIGVPISAPGTLWLLSTLTIAAIGTGALTVFAIFGSGIGALVNMLFFIALSMTSSGGTVPLAATPPFFQWLSTVEPFHPIVDGVRSILYFDASPGAGLTEAWVRILVGGAIGITVGILATAFYDRVPRFSRRPEPLPEPLDRPRPTVSAGSSHA